jgi:hypothetical protein
MIDNALVPLILWPEDFLPKYIFSTSDIYVARNLLKQIPSSDYCTSYLLDLILGDVRSGRRFKTLDCLRVVRAHLRNNPFDVALSSPARQSLFELFQHFVFHRNEDVREIANGLLIGKVLDDTSIDWLIENYLRSQHILNRLLRYPIANTAIATWARGVLERGELDLRLSEVIARTISSNTSLALDVTSDSNALVWAVYYAPVSATIKQQLLVQLYSPECVGSLWEVTKRLKLESVFTYIREQCREVS